MISINCRGKLLQSETPIIMGVINITPDSFYAGSRFLEFDKVELQVAKMLEAGARIIDIGAMSSRPGAEIISAEEEIKRLKKPIELIHKSFPDAIISLDTIHAETVEALHEHGISIINDISGGAISNDLIDSVARHKLGYVLMHMKGIPESMQDDPSYQNPTMEVLTFLKNKIYTLRSKGIRDVIIDPGFGFGKLLNHNYHLLKHLSVFKILDAPIMVGMSRKRMIQEVITKDAQGALNGTTVAHVLAILNGVDIIRAHDVEEAVEAVKICNQYNTTN